MSKHSLHSLLAEGAVLLHISCTGAGLRLQQRIWDTPGASKYFVGAATPYGHTLLRAFLGHAPEGSTCSREVALDMAMASYVQAAEQKVVQQLGGEPVGLALTAAVASERLPRGTHRAHLAVVTPRLARTLELPLVRSTGAEARVEHDGIIADAALELLERCLLEQDAGEEATEQARERCFRYPVFEPDGTRTEATATGLYLPATLDPLHAGHRAMCRAAEEAVGGSYRARYLVTTTAVHKASLSVQEMLRRAGMVRAERWNREARAVEFSRDDALFVDKARQRPGSTFVIGADTMQRMLDPRWGPEVNEVLRQLRNHSATFLVMGRDVDGRFLTCRDIPIPFPYSLLFRPLEGRFDISSTQLREKASA